MPATPSTARAATLLLVEDNQGDVRLITEALREIDIPHNLVVAGDGCQALDLLFAKTEAPRVVYPDLIFLDLHLPRKSGQEVLAAVKGDTTLKTIPVIMLTTSSSRDDVMTTYSLHANAYVTKSRDLDRFIEVLELTTKFWLAAATLPERSSSCRSPDAHAAPDPSPVPTSSILKGGLVA